MTGSQCIYMDNHATTRVDPRVVDAMLPFFSEQFGNAGSLGHVYGEAARNAIDAAHADVAAAIGAHTREVVFTSGATESNNLAIRGIAERNRRRGDHLVSVTTEHKAVLDPLARLGRKGYDITLLPVEPHPSIRAGCLDPDDVKRALREDTALVSVMLANNEIGVIQPIRDIAKLCKQRGILLHCDATQAVGKIPVDVEALGVDLMSFTAHKMYGPKGVGALYVRKQNPIVRLDPQITGGGQQGGRRSGTLNVPGIVGMAAAIKLCIRELQTESDRAGKLRNTLYEQLRRRMEGVQLCGPALDALDESSNPIRLPGNLNVAIDGVDGEALVMHLPRLAVSTGAACTSADPEPSHVLEALGLPEAVVRASLRFGLGRFNTAEEVPLAVDMVAEKASQLRRLIQP